jgi:hypothetical protein
MACRDPRLAYNGKFPVPDIGVNLDCPKGDLIRKNPNNPNNYPMLSSSQPMIPGPGFSLRLPEIFYLVI